MSDPIALGQTKEYVTEADLKKTEEKQTTWIIGALDSFQEAKAQAALVSATDIEEPKVPPKNAEEAERMAKEAAKQATPESLLLYDFFLVKYRLKGFKNFGNIKFVTEKEKGFNMDYDVIPDSILRQIPYHDIADLANAIWKMNKVSEELEKN